MLKHCYRAVFDYCIGCRHNLQLLDIYATNTNQPANQKDDSSDLLESPVSPLYSLSAFRCQNTAQQLIIIMTVQTAWVVLLFTLRTGQPHLTLHFVQWKRWGCLMLEANFSPFVENDMTEHHITWSIGTSLQVFDQSPVAVFGSVKFACVVSQKHKSATTKLTFWQVIETSVLYKETKKSLI